MNHNKAEKLFVLMKQYGVSHFKTLEVEIKMEAVCDPVKVPLVTFNETKPVPSQAAPPVDSKIIHHANEVANLLKLSDEDLVDKMFPDYSQMPAKPEGD